LPEIFVWNAAPVNETARRMQFYWMLEMAADVPQELFKERLLELPQRAAVQLLNHVAINANIFLNKKETGQIKENEKD
jgi:hypothetical protein